MRSSRTLAGSSSGFCGTSFPCEKSGYIAKRTAQRYRAPLSLTEEGMRVGKHIAERVDRVLCAAGEGVSEEARKTLYESLTQIHENLLRVCNAYDEKGN